MEVQFELQTKSYLMRFACQVLMTWMALEADFEIVIKKLVLSSSLMVVMMIKTVLLMVLMGRCFDCCTGRQRQ